MVGMAALAALTSLALGAAPGPASRRPETGMSPGAASGAEFLGCGRRAFLADIGAGRPRGQRTVTRWRWTRAWILCILMDSGVSRQNMTNQFAALNPALGPDGAAQVVRIAIRDLCPWHR